MTFEVGVPEGIGGEVVVRKDVPGRGTSKYKQCLVYLGKGEGI